MNFKALFAHPAERSIDGFLEQDDEANASLLLQSFVFTPKLARELERVLTAYRRNDATTGVWIAGARGSGKSHCLKLLAYLLENRTINGVSAIELIRGQLLGLSGFAHAIAQTDQIASRSVIFDITCKSDALSRGKPDAPLAILVRAFDEWCGYHAKHPHIAQFERELDNQGLYQRFCETFEALAGRSWLKGREQALVENKNIATAYRTVTGVEQHVALTILDRYRQQYRITLDAFVMNVNAFIERYESAFRLNFFIDGLGTFLEDDARLLANWQTIVTVLNLQCLGRAWFFVTSERSLDQLTGQDVRGSIDLHRAFGQEFNVSGQNATLLVRQRLLQKTSEAEILLSRLYDARRENIEHGPDHVDGARGTWPLAERDAFIACYPFAPYQLELFQATLRYLDHYRAFSTPDPVITERFLLGIFRHTLLQMADRSFGHWVTLDMLLDGIRTGLAPVLQPLLDEADHRLGDPLSLRVFKALFLMRYVSEMKPSVRNLCLLVRDDLTLADEVLHARVSEAIDQLVSLGYAQQIGDTVTCLNGDERELEQNIRSVVVNPEELDQALDSILYERVLAGDLIPDAGVAMAEELQKRRNDRTVSGDGNIAVHICHSLTPNPEQEHQRQLQNVNGDELLVLLPPDGRLIADVLLYKQTEKFLYQQWTSPEQAHGRRLVENKVNQNRLRLATIEQRVRTLLEQARLLFKGVVCPVHAGTGPERITAGLRMVMQQRYPEQYNGLEEHNALLGAFSVAIFGQAPDAKDTLSILQTLRQMVASLEADLEKLAASSVSYPFKDDITQAITRIQTVSQLTDTEFAHRLLEDQDAWLMLKEELIDPLTMFHAGSHRVLFDAALALSADYRTQDTSALQLEVDALTEMLQDPLAYRPENEPRLQQCVEAFNAALTRQQTPVVDLHTLMGRLPEQRIATEDELEAFLNHLRTIIVNEIRGGNLIVCGKDHIPAPAST